ncbi:hypothetical protein Agub_g2324 [Astrephomene gubernaculifera]|uniref:Uncharacterized protein n=1 Tax=Astrephomene gubernaculifera TaxID=47775 RepID=A0AAD3HII6_9CHLO|nr:hypothetical protein Agub_g2324 [Astrephomene gubernaculifera]
MNDISAIRQAVAAWHGRLLAHPVTQDSLAHGPQNGANPEAVSFAAAELAAVLEEYQLPDGLIDDLLSVCDTFTMLCGVTPNDVPDAHRTASFRSAPSHTTHRTTTATATTNGALTGDPDAGSGSSSALAPQHGLHAGHDRAASPSSAAAAAAPAKLHPAKLRLLRAAAGGLPVHTTSIGRRASASYCVYESMGGWETLSAAVESLYNRMRADPRCEGLFEEVNEQQLKTHMLEFLSCALGGKARFASSTLLSSQRDQLRSHGFGAGQFDVLLQHMKAVLDELGVQHEIAASAIALLRCHKHVFEKQAPEVEAGETEEQGAEVAVAAAAAGAVEVEEEAKGQQQLDEDAAGLAAC